MRSVFTLVLLAGLILAGLSVYVVQSYVGKYRVALEQEKAAASGGIELTKIYVIAKSVTHGDAVTQDDVRLVPWPVGALPTDVFSEAKPPFGEGDQPRFALRQMDRFEPLTKSKVTSPGEPAGLLAKLSPGQRAFAIDVDVISGVSGFIHPNDFVDVYWTGDISLGHDQERQRVTRLIETELEVVAIDQVDNYEDVDENKSGIAETVVVSVKPQQVARLALAQSSGNLSLSLVPRNRSETAKVMQVDQNELFDIQETVAKKSCTIKTRKGADVIITEIPCPDQ